jgi:hypothetical protein
MKNILMRKDDDGSVFRKKQHNYFVFHFLSLVGWLKVPKNPQFPSKFLKNK